jgi:PhnB protein
MTAASPVPEGFHTVTPHLVVDGASDAIEFYTKAFGAQEIARFGGPRGKLMYASIRIGDSPVMLTDEFPQRGERGPASGGSPVTIHLFVPDADAVFAQAVAAGAKVIMPLEDTFWGDRYGKLEDPFGHIWSIATRIRDMTHEEIMASAPTMDI